MEERRLLDSVLICNETLDVVRGNMSGESSLNILLLPHNPGLLRV